MPPRDVSHELIPTYKSYSSKLERTIIKVRHCFSPAFSPASKLMYLPLDPSVYIPGVYVQNMKKDGINDKATFYTDTQPSPHLRGRQSIVP